VLMLYRNYPVTKYSRILHQFKIEKQQAMTNSLKFVWCDLFKIFQRSNSQDVNYLSTVAFVWQGRAVQSYQINNFVNAISTLDLKSGKFNNHFNLSFQGLSYFNWDEAAGQIVRVELRISLMHRDYTHDKIFQKFRIDEC
jgi:hypothetical protein